MVRKTHLCPRCPQKFRSRIQRDNHLRDIHEQAGPSSDPEPPEGGNRCIHCSKDMPMEVGLTQHLRWDGICKILHTAWKKEQMASAHLKQLMPSGSTLQENLPGGNRASSSNKAEGGENNTERDGGQFVLDYRGGGLDQGGNGDKGEGEGEGEGDDHDDEVDDKDEHSTDNGSKTTTDSDDDANDEYLEEGSQSTGNNPDMMDLDRDLRQSPPPPDAPLDRMVEDEDDEVVLVEVVDQHGQRVYIEEYPCPTAGEPIRQDTTANRDRSNYPDVGELKSPDCFEIAQLLLESGVSARMLQGISALEEQSRAAQGKWTSPAKTERIRDEINTADWMWEIQ
ncbi:hypothetical protein FRC10_006791, partial [Ceratobasidium sp. 414]